MALEKLSLRAGDSDRGLRLDQFLARFLGDRGLSRRGARRLISAGAVYLDGRRTRVLSRLVAPGERVEVYWDAERPAAQRRSTDADPTLEILYEDEDLIAVDKPAGLAAQATVDDDVHHLFALVGRQLRECRGQRPYLALHHRLDRGTSGVQLLSKSRRANAGLAVAFRECRVEKLYLALASGAEPPDAWTVRDRLLSRRGAGEARRTVAVETGGRAAETAFEVRQRLSNGAILVEAVPKTGRTHQIRVHLANSDLPVVGDRLYGASRPEIQAPRPMLHAASLALRHPVGGEELRIDSPLPADFRSLVESLSPPGLEHPRNRR